MCAQFAVSTTLALVLYATRKQSLAAAHAVEVQQETDAAAAAASARHEAAATAREGDLRRSVLKWVCHEIRNPLTGVMGSLDVLLLRSADANGGRLSAAQGDLVENARSCAESILRVRCIPAGCQWQRGHAAYVYCDLTCRSPAAV